MYTVICRPTGGHSPGFQNPQILLAFISPCTHVFFLSFTFQFCSYPLHIQIPDHMQHALSHVHTFHVWSSAQFYHILCFLRRMRDLHTSQ
ncbi:hypothetical protein F5148DRAFT_1193033 [Russula earlei]|uniref:Uncharacterized protein n=1 Tax=Russula earlei TaxID=71964 RepID=A0ACC0UAJ7_9AGAM|nr:hypothetical protein F5148DRAFT_1193033 [Russula earlei]